MNVLFLLRPLVGENPRRSSAIYMHVTESMIKFSPLSFLKQSTKPLHVHIEYYYFLKCTIQRVSGFYTCKDLTRVQTVL